VNQKNEDISTIWGPNGYQFTQAMTAAYFSWQNSVDPDDAYYWSSTQIPTSPTGTGGNLPAYFHKYTFQAQIDQLTAAAAAELDQEKRKALYWQIQELLHEEVPCIFMWWPNGFPAAIKNLAGLWPSAANQLFWNVEQWALTQ
jgi:peptide/nickel transport system substrate-binding protein